jgi:ATP-dependent helicase/nuclease subunit B
VREVVRAIAAELETGIPLYRQAIVYRQGDPYATLVRETLDAAGLPWVSSEGLRLSASRPGRCLLGLLDLPDRSFTREAVMEWLGTSPVLDDTVATLPTATWDRLTRDANVLRGADQWDSRLQAFAATCETEAADLEREDRQPNQVEARRRQAAEARILAGFVTELAQALKPPEANASWADFVRWARLLLDRFVGRPERWPATQRDAAFKVVEVLESLEQADRIAWASRISLPTFVATLEGALDGQRIPTGRVGEGILVEPITALNGLAFDRVYLLGLVDGAFPPSPATDPFFPSGGPDPLERRPRQVAKERQDFLVSLTAADGGRLTLSFPDSYRDRAAIPSRWLLEVIAIKYGLRLDASEFATLGEKDNEWLRVIQSAQQAVTRAPVPADLEDRRLGEVARWTNSGLPFGLYPLARRSGLPLQRAIEQRQARRGGNLSRFDGNLSEHAATARRLNDFIVSGRLVSASAIQTWASCGYKYFLERVIRVEPTEQPEESPTIDALDRGTLIHKILEDFFSELADRGRPAPSETYDPDDLARMSQIADVEFAELQRRGVTGHPLVWENSRDSIRADLRSFLVVDTSWRLKEQVRPRRFEQAFGTSAHGTSPWPALTVDVEGARLRFSGVIDRIDLDANGTRAFVFDYKTGSSFSYAALGDDPVAAGQHIQLALYSQAVRANLPGVVAVGSAFWFISSKGEFEKIELNASPEAVDRRLSAVLGTITRGIRAGAFPRVPGAFDRGTFTNCAFCDFDRICPARRDQFARDTVDDPMVLLHASLGGATEGGGEE